MKNNWCIEGCQELSEYFRSIGHEYWMGNCPTLCYTINEDGKWDAVDKDKEYTIITLQEYLNMNKKIIGYKVKSEFKDVAAKVATVTDFDIFTCCDNTCHFVAGSIVHQNLEKAQVLNLWCTEVYESNPEFKVGDIVTVISDFKAGHKNVNDVFKVIDVKTSTGTVYLYFEPGASVTSNRVRKATEAEIEQYNSKTKQFTIHSTSGDFIVEVSKQGIFYKHESVWICPIDLNYVIEMCNDVTIQYDKTEIDRTSKEWNVSVNTVNIGCKDNCNLTDIVLAYNHYKSLQ